MASTTFTCLPSWSGGRCEGASEENNNLSIIIIIQTLVIMALWLQQLSIITHAPDALRGMVFSLRPSVEFHPYQTTQMKTRLDDRRNNIPQWGNSDTTCLILEQQAAHALTIWCGVEIDYCGSALNEAIFLFSIDVVLVKGWATLNKVNQCYKVDFWKHVLAWWMMLNKAFPVFPHAQTLWRRSRSKTQVLVIRHMALLVRHRNHGLFQLVPVSMDSALQTALHGLLDCMPSEQPGRQDLAGDFDTPGDLVISMQELWLHISVNVTKSNFSTTEL